jgi:hypothetical protein
LASSTVITWIRSGLGDDSVRSVWLMPANG